MRRGERARHAIVQQNRRLEVGARINLALAARREGKLGAAEAEADAAAKTAGKGTSQQAYALGALAAIFCDQGRLNEAESAAAQASTLLDALGGGLEEGELLVRLASIELKLAAGRRADAEAELRVAGERLRRNGGTIRDEALRRSFFEAVPEHRRLLALTAELLGDRPFVEAEREGSPVPPAKNPVRIFSAASQRAPRG